MPNQALRLTVWAEVIAWIDGFCDLRQGSAGSFGGTRDSCWPAITDIIPTGSVPSGGLPIQPQPANTPEPIRPEPIPPELLAWARQTFDKREYLDGVREIEATGGRSFDALVKAVESRIHGS